MLTGGGLSSPQRIVRLTASSFTDSEDSHTLTIGGFTCVRCNALAAVRIQVRSGVSKLTVYSVSNVVGVAAECSLLLYVDGVYSTSFSPTANSIPLSASIVMDGAEHLVELRTSWQQYGSAGTFPIAIAAVGGEIEILPNPVVDRRLAVIGDSISVGARATVTARDGWIPVARRSFSGRISMYGYGGAQINDVYNLGIASVAAAHILALTAGANIRQVWDALGYNDWAAGGSLVTYCGKIAALYDAIHAADPDAQIFCQTALLTGSESATNPNGDTIAAWRDAKASVATGRPFVTVIDGPDQLPAGNLSDGIHPTTAGHAILAANNLAALESA